MVKDPVADLLVRLKNAQAVKKESTTVPYSALLWEIAKVLEGAGFISKIDRKGKRVRRFLEATLVYNENGEGRISGARRISKQSKRVYKKAKELYPVKHGQGIEVVSTSHGVMTAAEARKGGVGGEILFEIW
ncbi:MAG: 30S ribosomal protein S8 [Candidatus Ryanbacteria bacterium RIFCSPHIGHO2_12_FULL_47_12b]|uniref:Small ribosomal subunit protein uS8 n=2 Tax=Candidatus Ryaniibacteriota TaxID=1817914 RepID=A0A1G2H3I4_9BACT|nr:MAG: 30S ribosomal protein S8 [Parcubacteria group bacterium GW2011_GWA2_47_10b]KKU86090.1 MAG: 30S ribosomal protein S8 [Parcubacteria group bacterium GW2011_GWA1_47_9]OGZ44748.1 MAG: 30S ribosomal protein S8 [Candidatus Ryanbacteria bacterium RIFCSPHIGHO2_01_FULL_48_80]OGZ48297.1 MAG: 30S ribosomal protein S8 [Candidatus Ryanbacteria bacterium RIFCSPHIGHO2_02_FULL_47_25]OGZ51321.1 MAG: 30S ribosomal protein S8 [Candidatus Ryanbacteria bacterium RIFCSPHIGHO2_12_FULL_47_12b]OGZ52219.1 MAG: 